jgi:hypothetical protein
MPRFGPVHYDYLALRMVATLQQKPSHHQRNLVQRKTHITIGGSSGIPTRFSNVGLLTS